MKQRIRAGQYDFPSPEWNMVSDAGKFLLFANLSFMLDFDKALVTKNG
jgi:hypothetical protein